jgi:hypothetical protein
MSRISLPGKIAHRTKGYRVVAMTNGGNGLPLLQEVIDRVTVIALNSRGVALRMVSFARSGNRTARDDDHPIPQPFRDSLSEFIR